MQQNTAKQFVLQLGSLISLYLSVAFLLVLTFGLINILFPDPADGVWQIDQAATSIRFGFAMVLVFWPTYLILTRLVNQSRRTAQNSDYQHLTKWIVYLSLLLGGLVLLIDLATVIIGFLEGELTSRFILKAAAVFVITTCASFYYFKDAKGYWVENKRKSISYAAGTSFIVILLLGAAITQIPNPTEVREMKIDSETISDLQDMQWRIEEYYRTNDSLPEDLETVYAEFTVPAAPENRVPYTYQTTGTTTYELCATFAHPSSGIVPRYAEDKLDISPAAPGNFNWEHQAGEWCFDRVIPEDRNLR